MATIIPKTIGAGGDYATLALWIADCPPDLVAVNQIWQGRLLAGEIVFSGTSAALTIPSSIVTSADCYVELTAHTGASFLDHADLATNPLRYDATKGASILKTGTSGWAITIASPYARVNKIQIKNTETSSSAAGAILMTGASLNNVDVNQCILESASRSLNAGTITVRGSGSKVRNTVIVQRSTNIEAVIAGFVSSGSGYNCTLVSLGAALTNGVATSAPAGTLKNIYVGGSANPIDGVASTTITNCHSDSARTGWTVTPFSTATFENVTDGTHNLRLKAGSGLIDVGGTESLNGATDIFGLSRPQGAGYDIGAHEFYVAATPAADITWTESNDIHSVSVDVDISSVAMSIGWTEGNDSHSVSATVDTASGQLTTAVIMNNTGIPRANLAGCAINIYNATTGALVLRKTGLTTNAEGRLVVLDAALTKATNYAYEVDLTAAGGGLGRRLPVGTTV